MYVDIDLIEDKLYRVKDQFNKKKITPAKLHSILLNVIPPFYDANGRMCNIQKHKQTNKAKMKKLII